MRTIAEALLQELDQEVPASRRVLERVPFDQFEWRPHPRSMSAAQLALHLASIPGNVARLAQTDGFDVATAPVSYPSPRESAELMETFERSAAPLLRVRPIDSALSQGFLLQNPTAQPT